MSDSATKLLEFYKKEISHHLPVEKPYALSREIKKFASLFTPGKFYYYIINFKSLGLDFVSDGTKDLFGVNPDEFKLRNLLERFHPDDLKMMEKKEALVVDFLLHYLQPHQLPLYKVVYFFRLKGKGNRYIKILHQTNVLTVAESGKLHHVLGIHTDVSHLPIVFNNKISFISLDNEQSYYNLDPNKSTIFSEHIHGKENVEENLSSVLTNKEKEIISRC